MRRARRCSPGPTPSADELAGIATDVRTVELGHVRARPLGRARSPRWSTTTSSCCPPHPTAATSPRAWPTGSAAACSPAPSRVTPNGSASPAPAASTCTTVAVHEPVVVTLQPGVRGVERRPDAPPPTVTAVAVDAAAGDGHDPALVEVLPPDVTTMDLAEAGRIVGGGAGLDDAARFAQLDHGRRRARRGDGRDARDHRPRLGRPRAPDRHDRRRRRPRRSTSRSGSAAPCSTPPASARRPTSSASTPTRTAR